MDPTLRIAVGSGDDLAALCFTRFLREAGKINPDAGQMFFKLLWHLVLDRWLIKIPPPDDPTVRVVLLVITSYFDCTGDWAAMEKQVRSTMPWGSHPELDRILGRLSASLADAPPGPGNETALLSRMLHFCSQVMREHGV